MNRVTAIVKISFILATVLLLNGLVPTHAAGQGHYTNLYFPGVDGKCGGWYAGVPSYDSKTWVTFSRPGTVNWKVFDGTKKLIQEGSQNILDGQPSNVSGLTLPTYGVPGMDWKGAKNPIHVVVTVDGDTVADLTADNPCLAGSGSATRPKPVAFNPADVKVPQDPTDRLVVRCRRDQFIISGKNDKGRLVSLTTLRLKSVIAAGADGLKKDLRRNGVLLLRGDGNGNFSLTWQGGPFKADGQVGSGFAKNFTCAYK